MTTMVYDVLGIGFGPSNLALAIAIEEHNAQAAPSDRMAAAFLEKQPRFGWHRGCSSTTRTMQVSFPKDLVTMRNPASEFSFLCYLQDKGRLVDFLNQKTLFPLRAEFHDHFEWAAARMAYVVTYSAEVTAVKAVKENGEIRYFDVITADGQVRRARNLSVAVGLEPHLPPGTVLSDRVWHTSGLVPKVAEKVASGGGIKRALVLGAGQSAAEAVDYLHRRSPTPRSARSSPSTATPPPTTVRSRTASSTRRRSTSTSPPPPR